ncbi:hypothetical protein B0H10DRAFT_1748371, partial [Mycena sp. CBHHK59/15]
YAEVQFFFQADIEDETITLALVELYSTPDQDLLEASSNTLWVCSHPEDESFQVIEVASISSVVGMVPF